MPSLTVRVPLELRALVGSRFRRDGGSVVAVQGDGTATVLHVVESIGIPRTEVGTLLVSGQAVELGFVPAADEVITITPVPRPQAELPQRYLLDVHLGALARRMRLLGLDTAYRNDASDVELVAESAGEGRVLLTQDRGLLRRRALLFGAFVCGQRPDDQAADVLDRFAPVLRPWTRCLRCNGVLERVPRSEVEARLKARTLATFDEFSRCRGCGQPYWRGAHANALEVMVRRATVTAAGATGAGVYG